MEVEKNSGTKEVSMKIGVSKMILNENSVGIEYLRSDEGDM